MLGRIHRAHIPLWAVRAHFPDAFRLLCEYDVYTVVREPFDRFRSAVAEYYRMNLGKEIALADRMEVEKEIASIIETLSDTPYPVSELHCHFIRQADFVELDGMRIANRLYPLSRMSNMLAEIGERAGIPVVPNFRRRETLDFRLRGTEKILRNAARLAYSHLPLSTYTRVQHLARRVFTRSGADGPHGDVFDGPALKAFVREYYRQDFQLWDAVSRQAAGHSVMKSRSQSEVSRCRSK